MFPIQLLVAVTVLCLSVAVGLLLHELAHAVALRASGVPCDVEWFPESEGLLGGGLAGRWATVTPRAVPEDLAPWRLRVASMMPLVLALPFVAALAGVVPDPLATAGLPLKLAVVGWLACSLPSPRDFSVLFHADRALADPVE